MRSPSILWRFSAGIAVLLAGAVFAFPSHAQTPPTIDGNLDDMIAFAENIGDRGCGLISDDDAQDVCKTQNTIIPCPTEIACPLGPGTYFPNGFDATKAVAVYDNQTGIFYFGFRTVGNIGDSNGDGSPGVDGANCDNPLANIQDLADIGATESYIWLIDTDCDGAADITVSVVGDNVIVTGGSGTTDFAFDGTDLEVSVTNLNPGLIWRLNTFLGSTTDGLSEDTTPQQQCAPPNLNLEIDKTADKTQLCPDEPVRFTIDVSNTGAADLLVSLVDSLPADLTYDNNVSGAFTFKSQVGQRIEFNDLTIPAGQTRSVSFDAQRSAECFGSITNVARATGTFDDDCLEQPLGVGPVRDTWDLECLDDPCVELVLNCPPAACAGDEITLSATATNCSDGTESITITLDGVPKTENNVAPGGTVNHSVTVTMPECTPGQNVTYNASATATNDCGTTDPVNRSCDVLCNAEACVNLISDGPDSACPGETITLTAAATNCSSEEEEISLTIAGNTKTENVAAGGTLNHSVDVTHGPCTGSSETYAVSATATNSCGETTKTAPITVDCDIPQIDVTKRADVTTVEEGGTISYTIVVTNPGPVDLVNITVTDELCDEAEYANNANPTPDSEPAVGATGGTIVWTLNSLAVGAMQTFTYQLTALGAACPDEVTCDNTVRVSGYCGTAEATDQASASVTITCIVTGDCWLTAGGHNSLADDGSGQKIRTWGGNVGPTPASSWNHLERDGEGNILFHFHAKHDDVEIIRCYDDGEEGPCSPQHPEPINVIEFGGYGWYNEGKGKLDIRATFFARCRDHGEPGNRKGQSGGGGCGDTDEYHIEVYNEATGDLVFEWTELIDGGNLQIHASKSSNDPAPTDDPNDVRSLADPPGADLGDQLNQFNGSLQLYTPVPNPFQHTTRIAYAVSGPSSERVDIAIYNVAGRKVAQLVSGNKGPGQYEVVWNGRDINGIQVPHGVYFMRAFVGNQRAGTSRLLYLR